MGDLVIKYTITNRKLYGRSVPASSKKAAIAHHKRHGDMDGRICLLNACALHYPEKQP